MKKLSVIIPAYQAEAYIKKCVQSILTNRIDLEVLIVNDGSTDNTEVICRKLAAEDPRVRVWTKENGGPGAAREYALAHAEGNHITFVDSDDYLEPGAYDQLENLLGSHDILEFGYRMVDTECNLLSEHPMMEECCTHKECGRHYAFQKNTTNYLCNKIFKRELFSNATFPHLFAAEDAALMAQLFVFAESYRVVPNVLYNYVMTPDSLCRKPFTMKRADAIKAYWFVDGFYEAYAPDLRFYAHQKLCSLAATLYCECYCCKDATLHRFLPQFVAEYRKARAGYSLRQILGHGSMNRRAMLLLFDVSPKLCALFYGIKRK